MYNRRSFLKMTGLAAITAILPLRAADKKKRPNILLILSDDMGYSDLGCMGGDAETPNIDALAANGLLFTDFYNNAKCAPTRASLMTGLSCQKIHAHHSAGNVIEHGGVTIAEVLKGDYKNLMIDKWHINPRPEEVGFERVFGSPLGAIYYWPEDKDPKIRIDDRAYTKADMTVPIERWYLTVEDTNYAIKFLAEEVVDKGKSKPFFMYYAPHNPHWPLQALPEDIKKYENTFLDGTDAARKRRYDRMVKKGLIDPAHCRLADLETGVPSWDEMNEEDKKYYSRVLAIHTAMVDRMDRELGRLFDYLKANDLFDNTVIIFTNDNGASAEGKPTVQPPGRQLGERGTRSRLNGVGASVCNVPLRKYKSTLMEGGACTPMIFHWPDGIGTPGRRCHQVGHVYDIMPTILDITGSDYPTRYGGRNIKPLDGISLLPAIRGEKPVKRTICWHYEGWLAVRSGNYKATMQLPRGDKPLEPWKLYNLAADRSETNDIAHLHPEIVKEMEKNWKKWNARAGGIPKEEMKF